MKLGKKRESERGEALEAPQKPIVPSPATPQPVTLGKKYRDSITGVEGIATARVEYLYGCVRIDLEGIDKDGQPKANIFDEQRLVSVEDDQPVKVTAKTGGDRPAPTQRPVAGRSDPSVARDHSSR